MQSFDVIIVGGGIVGLSLSLLLATETSLKIAVLEEQADEPVWNSEFLHPRVSAISLSSKKIFERIDIWRELADTRISPFKQMSVWDGVDEAKEAKKPKINFDSRQIDQHALGYIIENNLMLALLYKQLKNHPQISFIAPIKLTDFHHREDHIEMTSSTGEKLTGKLAIAADGAQSWLRKAAQIPVVKKDYAQLAIVANVTTALPHQHIARQIFLSTGPLAFLPLSETHISSIVWSLPKEEANRLLKLDDTAFKHELSAFEVQLGEIVKVDRRYSFPLMKQQAKHYIKPNVILVGDAAHTVHPLAGQGLNIGLRDVARLVAILHEQMQNHRDFSSQQTLRRYERASKAENFGLLNGIDMLHHLFLSDNKLIQKIRSFGLKLTDNFPSMKAFFIEQAL